MNTKYELKIKVMGKNMRVRVRQNDKLSRVINMLRQQQIIKNTTTDDQIKVINRQNYGSLTFQDHIRHLSVCQLSGIREIQVRVSDRRKYVFDDVLYEDNSEQIRIKCINYLLQNRKEKVLDLLKSKNFSYKYLELLQKLKKGKDNGQNSEKLLQLLEKINQKEQLYKNELKLRDQKQNKLKQQINSTFYYLIEMVESDICTQIKNMHEFSPQIQTLLDYIYHNITKLKSQSKIREIKVTQSPKQIKQVQKLEMEKSQSKISEQSLQSSEKKSEKVEIVEKVDLSQSPINSKIKINQNSSEIQNKNLIQSIQEYSKKKIVSTKSEFSINAPIDDLMKQINDKPNFILKFYLNQKIFGFFSSEPMGGKNMKSQKGFLFTFIDSKIEVIKPKSKQILWRKSQVDVIIGQKVIQVAKNLKAIRKKDINSGFDCRLLTNLQILGTDSNQFVLTNVQLMTVQFSQFEVLQSSEKSIKSGKGSNLKE